MSSTVQPFGANLSSENFESIYINRFSLSSDVVALVVGRLAKIPGNVYCEYQLGGPTGPVNFFYKAAGDIEVKRVVTHLSSQARHRSSMLPNFSPFKEIYRIKENSQYQRVNIEIVEQGDEEYPCTGGCTIA